MLRNITIFPGGLQMFCLTPVQNGKVGQALLSYQEETSLKSVVLTPKVALAFLLLGGAAQFLGVLGNM